MKPREIGRIVTVCLLGLGLLALGGCLLAPPVVEQTSLGLEPGTYYVARVEGEVSYLEFPEVPGETHRWVALAGEDGWFTGEGFYELSEDYAWSRDAELADLTFDDLLQLYDPLPAVPR